MLSVASPTLLLRSTVKSGTLILGARRGLASTAEKFGFDITLEPSTGPSDDEKKLAVICGWMGAEARHLKPYKSFYSDRGYDVLSFAVGPQHVLKPQTSLDFMEAVLDETLNNDPDKVVTHYFSVGGYLMGQQLRLLNDPERQQDKEKYHQLVKAQIYDSPPDVQGIAKGIGKSMAMGKFVATTVEGLVNSYLWAVRDTAGKHHRASSDHFHENHVPAPSLWLYSHSDPVAPPSDIDVVMKKWAAQGYTVEDIVWKDTPHIQHARFDPEGYFGGLEKFLNKHV